MTTEREREGIDRLRVGGWLPPARGAGRRAALPAGPSQPAHAAPEDDEPEPAQSPTPYEAPPVDLDDLVTPHSRAAAVRSGMFDPGRYIYHGRRRLSEMMAYGSRQQRARLALAGTAFLVLAIVAVAALSPDSDGPGTGQGLALPTNPPQLPAPGAQEELGSARPKPPATSAPPRQKAVPRPGPLTLYYEAEKAVPIGSAEVASLRQASGGRIVQGIGTGSDRRAGLLSFTEVDVPSSNRYALTVDYVSAEDRTVILSINTETHIRLSFPSSGGWDVVASRTFTISLVGGRNNLTFSNPEGRAPRLDRINLLG